MLAAWEKMTIGRPVRPQDRAAFAKLVLGNIDRLMSRCFSSFVACKPSRSYRAARDHSVVKQLFATTERSSTKPVQSLLVVLVKKGPRTGETS